MLDHNHNDNSASSLAQSENSDLAAQRWYIVQTHVRAELKATFHLRRQGFETYLPCYLKKSRHARRVDTVATPLFPRYLFVSVDTATQRWHSIGRPSALAGL